MSTPEEQLRDFLLHGLVNDIFFAEEARFVATTIGEHAGVVNTRGYRALFYSLQLAYSDRQTLHIAKLFDPPSSKYPTRSIPAVLELIERHASTWTLPQRPTLEAQLVEAGADGSYLKSLGSEALCLDVVAHYRAIGPNVKKSDALSTSLARLQESRSKVIAHNECLTGVVRSLPTWGDATALVKYAKEFAKTIAWGFLSFHLGTEGSYDLTYDASDVSRELEHLIGEFFGVEVAKRSWGSYVDYV